MLEFQMLLLVGAVKGEASQVQVWGIIALLSALSIMFFMWLYYRVQIKA